MTIKRALVFDTSSPNKSSDRMSDKNAALCANPLANVLRFFLSRRVLLRYPSTLRNLSFKLRLLVLRGFSRLT